MFQTVEIFDELVEKGSENMDVRNKEQVVSRMRAAVASKQFGQEDIICSLVADVMIYWRSHFLCYDTFLVHAENSDICLENLGMHPSVSKEPCKL